MGCGKRKCSEATCNVVLKQCQMIDGKCPECANKLKIRQALQQQTQQNNINSAVISSLIKP